MYSDVLCKIQLTSDQIKDQILHYDLTFSQVRDYAVEKKFKLPMFVSTFYQMLVDTNKIPTQEEFWKGYVEHNKTYFEGQLFDESTMEGVKARLFRTYPSLVRDVYFNKLVSENLPDKQIVYNVDLDVSEGIDMLVIDKDKYKGVCLYTDTKRAHEFRKLKENRHVPFQNVEYVEFPVQFKGSLEVGDFFLYGTKEFNQLKACL